MKAHIGADSRTKLVHSIVATSANVHDSKVVADLLHGSETRVYGDSAYTGKAQAIREKSPQARAFINKRAYRNRPLTDQDRETNRRKSSVRSRAEHIFGTVKGYFGFRKMRYRGIAKNENCLNVLFALSNLLMSRRNCYAFRRHSCLSKLGKSGSRPQKVGVRTKSIGVISQMADLPRIANPVLNKSDLP